MYKLKELLSPVQFIAPMHTRLSELEQAYKTKQAAVKGPPEGLIRIVRNHGRLQFYKRKSKSDLQGTYMPRSQNPLAYKLIQSDYDAKALVAIKEEITLIKSFLSKYKSKNTVQLFETLPETRQQIVTPLTKSDSQYAQEWLSINYQKKIVSPDVPLLFTDNKEQVRSKVEVLIANALKAAGVPYRYEFPIKINLYADLPSHTPDICTFHPDFYCLNLRTRKEYIWEHFGMMDDAEYSARAAEKLMIYQQNGYYPGKNLIITMETAKTKPSSLEFKQIIQEYLIN